MRAADNYKITRIVRAGIRRSSQRLCIKLEQSEVCAGGAAWAIDSKAEAE